MKECPLFYLSGRLDFYYLILMEYLWLFKTKTPREYQSYVDRCHLVKAFGGNVYFCFLRQSFSV